MQSLKFGGMKTRKVFELVILKSKGEINERKLRVSLDIVEDPPTGSW